MQPMGDFLEANGFNVVNIGYPSRKHSIEELARVAIPPALDACEQNDPDAPLYFVTHSLGGILLRSYLQESAIPKLQRAVMLAPPNNGSELADNFKKLLGYRWLIGKPMQQLGTDENDLPKHLGKVDFELGVIAGSKSYNPLYSAIVSGDDDGKVSVESSKVEGMRDHLVMPVSHSFLMNNATVEQQTLHFLRQGSFFK